jgi:hypothetical protein
MVSTVFLSGIFYCDFLCLGERFPGSALKKLENLESLRIWELLQEKVTYNAGGVLLLENLHVHFKLNV